MDEIHLIDFVCYIQVKILCHVLVSRAMCVMTAVHCSVPLFCERMKSVGVIPNCRMKHVVK